MTKQKKTIKPKDSPNYRSDPDINLEKTAGSMNKNLDKRWENSENTLFLVDISSFIFRAFFAIRVLTNRNGEPTNATYGVATMLKRLLDEANPKYVGVVYDSKEPSFRKELFEEYKANRSEPPDDLVPQFAQIDQLVKLLRFHSFRAPGYEADDLIATLTKRWCESSQDHRVVIVTGDKDLMQLVNDQVSIWDTMKQKVYGHDEVIEKFGVTPEQIQDYLALVGDSSDNIPGVPSIGPKTAVHLLGDYGSLDSVLKAAEAGAIPGKKGQVIKMHRQEAELSKKLVALEDQIDVSFQTKDFEYQFGVSSELTEFLKEMDFKTLVQKWAAQSDDSLGEDRSQSKQSNDDYRCVQSLEALKSLVGLIEKTKSFCFDLETTSLNTREAEIVGVAISVDERVGYYIPVGHDSGKQLELNVVLNQLKPYFENPSIQKIAQNLKYDQSVLLNVGIKLQGSGDDTMLASYVLDSTDRHNFNWLCQKYFNHQPISYESLCGKGKNEIKFNQVEIDKAGPYAAEDALYTYRLWIRMRQLLSDEGLTQYYEAVERPLVPVLTQMEREGVRVDLKYLENLSEEFQKELNAIEKKIFQFSNEPFNLNSPKQLGQFLFEELKLKPKGKKKTGYSTDAKVLQALAQEHEVADWILQYRELSKLKGTYVDPLPLLVDPKTKRIHGSFHQTGTATGRLSSSHPNLQNIPIRTERGQKIRRAFIASDDSVLLAADYSQVELRILAHMSEDPRLVEAFQNDEDIHRKTASDIFGVSLEDVDSKQRSIAKAINFGLMYGKTAFGLSQELKISRTEAKDFIDRYFNRYQKVKAFLDHLIESAKEDGYVKTLLGRKRYLKEIHSKNPMIRQNSERMAMNSPVQGTAAELMKLAMIRISEEFNKLQVKSKLIIQVHDEVVIDCLESEQNDVAAIVNRGMTEALDLKVPLKVNIGVANNWMDVKAV